MTETCLYELKLSRLEDWLQVLRAVSQATAGLREGAGKQCGNSGTPIALSVFSSTTLYAPLHPSSCMSASSAPLASEGDSMFLKLVSIPVATLKGTGIFLLPRRDVIGLVWGRSWLLIQPAETEWIESCSKIVTGPWGLACQEVSGVSHGQQVVIDLRTRLCFYHFI